MVLIDKLYTTSKGMEKSKVAKGPSSTQLKRHKCRQKNMGVGQTKISKRQGGELYTYMYIHHVNTRSTRFKHEHKLKLAESK